MQLLSGILVPSARYFLNQYLYTHLSHYIQLGDCYCCSFSSQCCSGCFWNLTYLSSAGCQSRFRIGCKRRREYGYSYVPGVLTFETERDGEEFHILRFLSVRIVSDLYDDLKQTSEYKPPERAPEIPRDVKTTLGIRLPR